MRKLGFWTDGDRNQVNAINEAADDIGALQANTGQLQRRTDVLHALLKAQQAEIVGLKAALQAICDYLVDQDLADEEALAQRIAAAVADPPAAARPAAPERHAAPKLKTGMQCAVCKRDFSARALTFTDQGPTCGQCIAGAGG